MEKTSTKTIERKDAAAELIAVDDPEALSRPKCLHPLNSPVFQSVRSWTSRLFGIACPNTIYGRNLEKMRYHERTEHEKTCPSKAVPGQFLRWVVKMGPCGGGGGDPREMDVRGVDRICKVVVWHRAAVTVDAMSVVYERDGVEEHTEHWGQAVLTNCSEIICLDLDEYLTGMRGHLGDCNGRFCVRSLTFVSNMRTFGGFGREEGLPFELPATGGKIVGFHGRFSSYLDALGTYVKMDA